MMDKENHDELLGVVQRYARRLRVDGRYSMLKSDVWHTVHERQRAMIALFLAIGWFDLERRRLIEVGSGSGGNLLELLRLGFDPSNLRGVELLPERHAQARRLLPEAIALHLGDAMKLPVDTESHDAVLLSTVFSSILDDVFQQQLADTLWDWVKPGGGVLWYDFTLNNPRNPDVRGVPLHRVRELFPRGRMVSRRVTLAPPIARRVTRVHPSLYTFFNAIPLLRTHVLAWIEKPLH